MVPQSWLLECARMVGVAQKTVTLKDKQNYKLEDSEGKELMEKG